MSEETEYVVKFNFTTFDIPKSMATGREGSINIFTKVPKEEIDVEEVKQLCVNEVLRMKPKWNILMLDVQSVLPFTHKRRKQNSKPHENS